jgi:predicted ATPase/DNA-binding SARP family transcriptional activator
MLKLAFLGHPQIWLHGEVIQLSSSKAMALLCYLAAGDRPYSRTFLAGLLWGDKTEVQARRNLRVALTRVRQAVGDYVVADHKTIAFNHNRERWLDVQALRAATEHLDDNAESARSALDLIRGDFLEDLQVREAPEFELWLLGEREHYRQLGRNLMLNLLAHDLAAGQYEQGLVVARRLVEEDPWREEAHRWLIHFLALNGQQGAALAQYETCRQIIAEELGVEPSVETRELAGAVRAGQIHGESHQGKDVANNLPLLATSFVGRRQEMIQVHALLANDTCHLLVLLGPGGIGKSRLALEAGRAWLRTLQPPFPDGLFFVPLTDVTQEASLELAIAGAMGLPLRGETPPLAQLQAHLRQKRLLLILDNFERLASRAGLLLDLLAQAPGVKLLVTSRQRLPLLEAWHLDLEGLAVPPDDSIDNPAAYGAVQLFLERARRINLSFDLAAEAADVCRICRLVEGMPLALELAAAWTRGLSCRVIAERIAADLDTLAFSSPSLPVRQRSLESVFRHSWELLSTDEQTVFAGLSLFRGGFTLAAAEAIVGTKRRHLLSLVDKSLVRRLPTGRYDIHLLLRRLANNHLGAERSAELQAAHTFHFAHFLAEREGFQHREEAPAVLDEIALELDNIRAAWQQAMTGGDEFLLAQMMEPLNQFYDMRGYFTEGLKLMARTAEVFPPESLMAARLRYRQARFAFRLGQNTLARRLGTEALTTLEAERETLEMAGCLLCLGNVVRDMGEHTAARNYFRRSAELFAGRGDYLGEAAAANNLGVVHYYEDDVPGAIRHFEAALFSRQRAGITDTTFELGNIGLCYGELGDHDRAIDYLEQSLEQARRLDRQLGIGLAHHNLGNAFRNKGNPQSALSHLQKGIALFRALGSQDALAASLADLASTLVLLRRFDAAHKALREGMALEEALERPRGIAYKHLGLGNLYLAQDQDEPARIHYKAVLSGSSAEFGADLLLNALLGIAVIEVRAGRPEPAEQAIASISVHPKASYETKQAARHWSSQLGLVLERQAGSSSLESLLAWARGD